MQLDGGEHEAGDRRTGRSRLRTSGRGGAKLGEAGLGTAGLGLLGLAVAAGLGARAVQLVTAVQATGLRTGVDALVELVVVGSGAVLAAWLGLSALVASLCLGARAAGHAWRGGERLVGRVAPPVIRRTLSVTIAAGIGLGSALGAQAAPPPAAAVGVVVQQAPGDLGWPVTDPGTAPSAPPADPGTAPGSTPAAPEPAPATLTPAVTAASGAGAARQVVVQPGDTLWGIARRHLPEGASQAQVAAAWPAWYEANRETVGPDPDLIRPGQVLLVPVEQS